MVIIVGILDEKYDWLKVFSTHISHLDHYAKKSVKAIQEAKHYAPINPKIISLLRTYDSMKTDERLHQSMAATHWEKFYKKYAQMKQNLKGTSKEQVDKAKRLIQLSFLLMEKDHIENVTRQDCRKLCELIYRVPKKWMTKMKDMDTIHSILTDNPKLALSKSTIQDYLSTFKEFMRYAVKEEIIENNLNEFVDIPARSKGTSRSPFTTQDLHKIFNPNTYPDPHNRGNLARFWIPLLALYHGARLNEVCQLDVDDIVVEKKIPCISINDSEGKSLKNRHSKRVIPIHPKLIEMGFLDFVEFQRKNKEKKLFCLLRKQRGHNSYGGQIQHWFARYLDSIGIKGKDKVFHSFRHTFETMATNVMIPPQYQNALCGWTDQGVGQRIYAHKKDITVMLKELSKVNYPINREVSILQKSFMDSFVIKSLRAND